MVPVLKEASCAEVSNNRPVSITPILSELFEELLAKRLITYFETIGYLPKCQFAYHKGLSTCDALLSITNELLKALDSRSEVQLVQFDFSVAFNRVSHDGILHKFQNRNVGGPMLSIIEQYLRNKSQRVEIDGSYSYYVNVVSKVPQGSVLKAIIFVIYTADLFDVVENKLVNYADDSTLFGTVDKLSSRECVFLPK